MICSMTWKYFSSTHKQELCFLEVALLHWCYIRDWSKHDFHIVNVLSSALIMDLLDKQIERRIYFLTIVGSWIFSILKGWASFLISINFCLQAKMSYAYVILKFMHLNVLWLFALHVAAVNLFNSFFKSKYNL